MKTQWIKMSVNRILRSFGYKVRGVGSHQNFVMKGDYWCARRLLYFRRLIDSVKEIDGDIVECGVGKGETFFLLACLTLLDEGKARRIWGFDSFEGGFPEPSPEDASSRQPKIGEWQDLTLTENAVYSMLRAGGLPQDFVQHRIKLVKGFFDRSLTNFTGEKVALLHLDVDLYESYRQTLSYFWPRVQIGGVVMFDEYKQPGIEDVFLGAAKAIDEFFGESALLIKYDPIVRRYYIVMEG